MCIDLCGRYAGMSEDLPDGIQICPPVQHVRCECMPQYMGTPSLHSGHKTQVCIYHPVYKLRVQRFPLIGQEKIRT